MAGWPGSFGQLLVNTGGHSPKRSSFGNKEYYKNEYLYVVSIPYLSHNIFSFIFEFFDKRVDMIVSRKITLRFGVSINNDCSYYYYITYIQSNDIGLKKNQRTFYVNASEV